MLPINDPAVDWRAIRVHIENRQEDSDTARFRFENFILIQLDNLPDASISWGHDQTGSVGDARSGSRKKATVQKISSKKNADSHADANEAATAATAKNARIQRASESFWRRIKEVYFRSPKEAGQDGKNESEQSGEEPQYHGLLGRSAFNR